jgi:predicted nucleotidyltransferase
MIVQPAYPTQAHAAAAEAVTALFAGHGGVEAVLLVNSCARGKASPDSCLDIIVLLRPEALARAHARLEDLWHAQYPSSPVFQDLLQMGAFSHVDLDWANGDFHEPYHGWTSGADGFELEVGNTLAYSAPLWEGGSYFRELKTRWLPYYSEDMRARRLEMVLKYCRNNLRHIPLYAPRQLYFQCFKRFHQAFEEFLQALFIARRTYPIAYDKWVKEEVVEILGLPDLYAQLPPLFEIRSFESQEIVSKARQLEELLETYVLPLYEGGPHDE